MKTIRLLLLIILLAKGNYKAAAQCAENIRMYELGMQLYAEGKYHQAAEAFAIVDSLDNLDFDEYDNRKGYGKQWQAHCYYNMNEIEKAKSLSEGDYDMLPVDRRLMQVPDSLSNLALDYFFGGHYEKAEHLYNQSLESIRALQLTHFMPYFYVYISKAQSVASAGKKAVFMSMADSILAEFDRVFPAHDRVRKYILKSFCDTALGIDDINLFRMYYDSLVKYLEATKQYEDPFTVEVMTGLVNISLNHGEFEVIDMVAREMLRLMEVLYGKESPQYIHSITSLVNTNVRIRRWNEAMAYINQEETFIGSLKGKNKEERIMLLHVLKANLYAAQGHYEEAIQHYKWVYKHADYRTPLGQEYLAVALSCVSMLKSIRGDVDNDLVEELKHVWMRVREDSSNGVMGIKHLLMASFSLTGYIKECVQIADELAERSLNNIRLDSDLMLVYLGAGEYIKARKCGHRALEMLNDGLGKKNLVSTALAYETEVDNWLKLLEAVRRQNEKKYATIPDTIKYALNLLTQDVLHAKLRILAQKDSMGSESFMSTLESFYFLARNENEDIVVADSIMNEYATKVSSKYGENAEVMKKIDLLKERCEFERTDRVSAFLLRRFAKGSDLYNDALKEYNSKFDEWRRNKGQDMKEVQTPKAVVPSMPYAWTIDKVANLDSLFNAVWQVLTYYEANAMQYEIMRDARSWCYSAQKAHRIDSLASFVKRMLPKMQYYNKTRMMGYVWLYAGEEIFDECLPLIYDGVHNDAELEFACLLYAINEHESYCEEVQLEPIMRRINRIMDTYRHSTDKDDNIRYYSALVYINLVRWRNSVYWKIDQSQLKEDFVAMYHEIGKEQLVWKYREFNQALDIACLLHETSDKDSLLVEINRIRIAAQADAAKAHDDMMSSAWRWMHDGYEGLVFPAKILFPSIDLYENECDQVYMNVHFAYWGQQQYQRDYEYYKLWLDFFKKRYASDDGALSKRLERLLGDMVWSCNHNHKRDEKLNGLAYDLAIWNKGYLLRSEQQVVKILRESGNLTILERYKEYINLKQKLSDSKKEDEHTASIQQQAESIWNELKRSSKTFEDYTKYMDASWRDVQVCLGDKDLAIEYVSTDRDYFALLLKKDYVCPHVTHVGSIDDIVKEKGDSIYTGHLPYGSPWPTSVYYFDTNTFEFPFDGVENVYFSPAGSLNKFSIENMKADIRSDSLMSEKYHLYRLSNTRELMSRKSVSPKVGNRKAILFGGINYDFSQEDWASASSHHNDTQLLALRSNEGDGRGAQNVSLSYLQGTKTEVDAISSVLKGNRVKHAFFSGNDATEDAFKNLSNQGVTSMHIATHGFYSTDTTVEELDKYGRPRFAAKEDKSMMQNGLYFAGANANFYGEDIPVNVNDGMLTAQEVSYLDFTDCGLVTLSACETGLGEVSGEGVFGLQRGFKKAGVNSILMSLWKVDDEATCKLMTEFYTNWIAKQMTKYDALEAAKKVVRETKGWEDPKYWAAFILLDALD